MVNIQSKKTWFLISACCLLFLISACGNTPLSQPVNTQQTSKTPALTSTATASLPTSSCPEQHPAVMPTLPTGSHPNIVYLSEGGGLQTGMRAAQLIRYDTITKSKTILLSFAQTGEEISDAQISTNGQ